MAATAGVEGRNLLVPVDDAEVMPAGLTMRMRGRLRCTTPLTNMFEGSMHPLCS
jgi:hypothetical protein